MLLCKSIIPFKNKMFYSTNKNLINIIINEISGNAIIKMQQSPVNSINYDLCTQMSEALTCLENERVKGAILTSAIKNVFCAGLDFKEICKPVKEKFKPFWYSLQETCSKLYTTPFPTVALINGHAVAGGCVFAMSCDYRIIMDGFTIGLNEVQLGIIIPEWIANLTNRTVGRRNAEIALTSGHMYNAEDSLKMGFVDEIGLNEEECFAKAELFLKRYENVDVLAASLSKNALRYKLVEKLFKSREKDMEMFYANVSEVSAQNALEDHLKGLKMKKKK